MTNVELHHVSVPVDADDVWLSTEQTAALMGVSARTVRERAMPNYRGRAKPIHGHHSADGSRGGRWSFRRPVIALAVQGATADQQRAACGCGRLAGITKLPGQRGRRR